MQGASSCNMHLSVTVTAVWLCSCWVPPLGESHKGRWGWVDKISGGDQSLDPQGKSQTWNRHLSAQTQARGLRLL